MTPGLPRFLRRGRTAPAKPVERDRRAMRTTVIAGIIALLVLPVARPVGYGLADGLCTDDSCDAAFSDVPVCSTIGRDRAFATGTRTYESPLDLTSRARLNVFGGGDVVITVPEGEGFAEYRFPDLATARHWVFDRSDGVGRVVDSSAGPLSGGIHDGLQEILIGLGMLSREQREPVAEGRTYSVGADPRQSGMRLVESSTGTAEQVLVPDFPLDDTPALTSLAHRLGIADSLVLTIERSPAGEPVALEISGLGAGSWSLSALRAPESSNVAFDEDVSITDEGMLWRSFTLDLRRQANRGVYDAVFTEVSSPVGPLSSLKTGQFDFAVGAGEIAENPYRALGDRVAADAVFVEQDISTGLVDDDPTEFVRMQQAVLRGDFGASGPVVSSGEVRSADLSVAGAQAEALLSCSGGSAGGEDAEGQDADDGGDD